MFRDEEDYCYFNNKFASCSYSFQMLPLAQTTLSTHFHALIETADAGLIGDYITKIKKSYALYYAFKYDYSIRPAFKISFLEITGRESILNELLYVLKNAVHHYIVAYPFEYNYSSVSYLFMDKLLPPYLQESVAARTVPLGELSGRKRTKLIGKDSIPDNWLVLDEKYILPSSYINSSKARAFWNNNVKSFIYDINKNGSDARKEIISDDILDLKTAGKTDTEICKIIDEYTRQCGHQSFHHLPGNELHTIERILKQRAVAEQQIKRCLWL